MRTIMNRMALRLSTRWSPARARWCSSATYKEILTERRPGGVGLITLNREKQLNALTPTLTKELVAAAKEFDADPEIGAIVVTGSGSKAFAAGADIKTMASLSYMDMYKGQIFSELDDLSKVRKPVIAAVNGFALGGGCELAMACDFILASDTAKFGCAAPPVEGRSHATRGRRAAILKAPAQSVSQTVSQSLSALSRRGLFLPPSPSRQPEIKLGTIPGLGGTQRFTRALGKARAMELCLTGGLIGAEEAVSRGLASRVVPAAELLDDACVTAATIASMSQPIVAIAKTCVNVAFESSNPDPGPTDPSPNPNPNPNPNQVAFESSLAEGLRLERALFYSTFATQDQKIGMKAFVEKAEPAFKHE